MQLTNIQERTVEKILSLYDSTTSQKIDFKAPTGSGKTLMATHIISALIDRNPNDEFIFVIATPSSSSLPFFFEQKINLYKKDLSFTKFEVEYIESPSSNKSDKTEGTPKLFPENNKVFIFGKSTFGKRRIFTERSIIDDFVQVIQDKEMKLVYIRDEAHIGGKITSDSETKRFENLMQDNAHFVINMTATPDYSSDSIKVILKESELNNIILNDNKWLLKTTLTPLLNKDISDDDLMIDAIEKFKQIKEDYLKLEAKGIVIRPAMLVQVDNEPSRRDEKDTFFENLDKVKSTLTQNGLSWVQYFGDSDKDSNRIYKGDFTLDDITKIDNEIDVVIFKIGPSTGWDIPRACVLMQLRNVSSSTLNTQTIGRIKRNPYPGLEQNEITDKYYIYSNAPKIDEDITVYSYDIKNELIDIELASIKITNKRQFSKSVAGAKFESDLFEFLQKNQSKMIQELKNMFLLNDKGDNVYRKERLSANNHVIYSDISNVFVFLKELERLQDSKAYLNGSINNVVKSFYESKLKDIKLYGDYNIVFEQYIFLILSNYSNEMYEIIRRNSPFKPSYKIEMVQYEPEKYIQVYDGQILEEDIEHDKYLFKLKKNDDSTFYQPLDSHSEEVALSKLRLELYALGEKVKLWCKNLTSSNINGEYFDKNHNFKRSFFDFVVKFSNESFLYIEVKSENDIDPEKTQNLREAYEDYFSNKQYTLFDKPIVICIWKVSPNGRISQEVFYDSKLISEDLNVKTYKELIKTLGNL